MKDYTFKICIFGDGGVGKTTLTERFLTGLFKDDINLTIGTNFFNKTLQLNEKEINLQIWDFGGERKFRQFFPKYVIGSSGGLFLYDITRFSSLKNIKEWMTIIEESKEKFPIIVVGSKVDLEDKRAVAKGIAEKLIKKYGFLEHIECSAKKGYNVELIFERLTLEMMKRASFI